MLDFLRPAHDASIQIMIPEECSSSHHTTSQLSSNSDEEFAHAAPAVSPRAARRHYKSFTVMQKSGFQHTEYVQVITHLCKAEVFISFLFLIHGLACPGFPKESSYQGTCHINVLSALVGIFTGSMGLGAVHRFRWKTMLVMWLIMSIISSVSNLLAVITTGVWLDHLSKLKERTGLANGLSGLMLLGSVLVGVCFILTSVLICHYWASNSTQYQAVGRISKRQKALRRRVSRVTSCGSERCSSRHHHVSVPEEKSPNYYRHHEVDLGCHHAQPPQYEVV